MLAERAVINSGPLVALSLAGRLVGWSAGLAASIVWPVLDS